MKKNEEHGILEAIFNIDKPREESLIDILFGTGKSNKPSVPTQKRPWQSNKEECPNCGSFFPVGGTCPGCGLHDEEMPWNEG